MKLASLFLLSAAITLSSLLSSCTQPKKQEKVTDVTVTTQSNEAMTFFRQGLTMADQGDRQQARNLFSQAIEKDPKMGIAYVMRSNTANSTQEFIDDINMGKQNMQGAGNWETWYCNYQETFLTSDWNKRMEIAKTMADSFPDVARTQISLGDAYSQGNDESKARECYAKATSMDSNWVGGYYSSAISYLFLEPRDFKKAEGYAEKCVMLAPNSPGAEILLGDCYRAENDLAKARDAYAKAVTLNPDLSEAYFKEGHANTFLGNYDEARKNYEDGAKHNENLTENDVIAFTYAYAGDYKTASAMLMSYAMKVDSSGESKEKINDAKLNYLMDCQRMSMQGSDAAEVKNCMAMTDPMNMNVANSMGTPEAKLNAQATSYYWQSILSAMEGNFDTAKKSAEQIKTTLDPITDPNKLDQYHFAMGYISYQQKNYADAVSHFEMSHPEFSVYTKYWLARANEAAGNKEKAEALYKDIAMYNFNGIDYALVRNEVVNRKPVM